MPSCSFSALLSFNQARMRRGQHVKKNCSCYVPEKYNCVASLIASMKVVTNKNSHNFPLFMLPLLPCLLESVSSVSKF